MKKCWKKLILFALMLVAAVVVGKGNVKAATIIDSGSCGDNATYILDSDGVLTISGSGEISDYAFAAADYNESKFYENVEKIERLIIENGITKIGYGTFGGCSNLKSVSISESVLEIGNQAFRFCSSLTNITIPESMTRIGENAFGECGQIESIYIPRNVEYIGRGAFSDIKKAITVAVENKYYNSKNNCNAIIENATNALIIGCGETTIPNDVTEIDYYAFRDCNSLTNITIPESVTKIGRAAFQNCSSLTNITIPKSITSISGFTFDGCSSLTSIIIPESVTGIWEAAFQGCYRITDIVIPEGVTYIGSGAFGNCDLRDIIIPKNVTNIREYAFSGNNNLESITLLNKDVIIDNDALKYIDANYTIYGYNGSTAETYATANNITFKAIDSTGDSENSGSNTNTPDNGNTDAGNTGSDASNYGAGSGSGSGAAGGSAAQPSGSGSTGATGTASTADSSSATDATTSTTTTTTTKTKLTTKNTTIKLSKTSYTYDGKAKKPTVKVLNAKGKVLKSSNYTVKYSNNVKAGKATVTIKFKGKYTGTIKATYTIKPKTTAITGATRNGSKVALIWKKQATQTSGYQIQYATDKKFTKDKQLVTASGAKKTSKTIKNVSEDKSYYFRIRTYKTVNGKKVYSAWSKVKTVKVDK